MAALYKIMCGCKCCISAKSMHSSLLTWISCRLKHLKNRSHNAQNRRSGEISSRIFETYSNDVWPHGFHFYNTTSKIYMAKFCPCTSKYHGLLQCKCFARCCDKCPSIFLPSQEVNKNTKNTCPTIRFHV